MQNGGKSFSAPSRLRANLSYAQRLSQRVCGEHGPTLEPPPRDRHEAVLHRRTARSMGSNLGVPTDAFAY